MPPLSPAQISQTYQDALRRLQAGDLTGAEARLREVLAAQPRQAEALFQMGRIALSRGAAAEAAAQFAKAAAARPNEAAIWKGYAQAVAATGDRAAAKTFLKTAKSARLDPRLLTALQAVVAPAPAALRRDEVERLLKLVNTGQLPKAEAELARLRAKAPGAALLADIEANIHARQNRPDAARRAHEEALRLDPRFVEGRVNYGRFLIARGEVQAGLDQLREAARRAPKPGPVLAVLGQALLRVKDYAAAAEALGKAVAAGDGRAATHAALADALDHAGRPEAALAAHDAAVAAAPERPETHGRRAILLQQLGRFDEAEAGFRRAIALDPANGEPYRLMVKGRKLAPDAPVIAEMEALYARPDLSDRSRMNLAFALAKAMEDAGRHDRIFAYLHEANALMRKLYPYDIAERRTEVDALKAAFADTDFTARRVVGAPGYAPIFVTGMPRSGTTLVEQIIASHSRVTGGGELGYAVPEALRLMADGQGGLRPLSAVADAEIAGFGQRVEDHFRMRLPGADIVTDKSIQTYAVAGLMRLALPNARLIVVHRDPRDVGLSIYKNIFAEGTHRYAYSLRDLGLYYRMHREMIAFWRDRLPGGLYEIRYEDLIADPEGQARALIAACGLDWEDSCLNFHETERRVSTLSLHQVRQPIYASSMQAWQRHEDDLAELIEALGDAID